MKIKATRYGLVRGGLVLALLLAGSAPVFAQEDAVSSGADPVFDAWFARAFGVRVGRNAEGRIAMEKLPNLADAASSWHLRNGMPGRPLEKVPAFADVEGDFLFMAFDLSAAWPEAKYVKRHVIYYLGDGKPYALVADEIESDANDFWTMRLPLPEETTPVNWAINLQDADRQADLLAGLEEEFAPEIELNKPVSGYAKARSGTRMLLARLLSLNAMTHREADRMSPMNIRIQDGRKWLTAETQSRKPAFKFALMPYLQNRDEFPTTILSPDTVRMEWFQKSHRFTFFDKLDGNLAMMIKSKRGANIEKLAFRMEYQEIERPKGSLVAGYSFEELTGDRVKDRVGVFDAVVERGKLVDGLQGKSIYLGYPDRPQRNMAPAAITIPEAIREKLKGGHLSISFWYKSPLGQAKGAKASWMWPIGEMMRGRSYLDTGFFNVGHLHYAMNPITKGFNGAWHIRANSGDFEPGKWNHLVFSMQELDPAEFLYRYEVYINGDIRSSVKVDPLRDKKQCQTWNQVTGPITIGNLWGTIDNLMIFNYPLNEDEVASLYEGQLNKEVSYYSCDVLEPDGGVSCVPVGDYPEDSIVNNRWVPERTFAGSAPGAKAVPGVKGGALALAGGGLTIPEKALWDLSQGAFTFSFYFKYSGKGAKIMNNKGMRLNIEWNKLHGAIGNDWGDRYLGQKEGSIEPDVWHHLALAYNKRSMVAYLDGEVLYDRPMASKEGINFTDPVTLGGNCEIDEIHIHNYAIGADEVRKLARYLPRSTGASMP